MTPNKHEFEHDEDKLTAYVVEACIGCRWHHLRTVLPVGGR